MRRTPSPCKSNHVISKPMRAPSTSSSDSDDEEAERLRSVAVDSASVSDVAALLIEKKQKKEKACSDEEDAAPALKFYQARARGVLHKYLDRTFELIPTKDICADTLEVAEDSGFHLFKNAPSGLSERGRCQEAVISRKRRFRQSVVDEASEMFQSRLLASATDGAAVKLYAEKSNAKTLALWALQQAEENEAKRKEEERVALLKLQRGELWLPSVARDMQRYQDSDGKSLVTSMCTQNHAKASVSHNLSNRYANGNFSLGVDKLEKAPQENLKKRKQRLKTSAVTETP